MYEGKYHISNWPIWAKFLLCGLWNSGMLYVIATYLKPQGSIGVFILFLIPSISFPHVVIFIKEKEIKLRHAISELHESGTDGFLEIEIMSENLERGYFSSIIIGTFGGLLFTIPYLILAFAILKITGRI